MEIPYFKGGDVDSSGSIFDGHGLKLLIKEKGPLNN